MKTKVTLVSTRALDDQHACMSIVPAESFQRKELHLDESRRAFFVHYPRAKDPAAVKLSDLRIGDVLFWQDPEDNICDDGVITKIEQNENPINVFANCPGVIWQQDEKPTTVLESFARTATVFLEDWHAGRLTAQEVCKTLWAAAECRKIVTRRVP